jgi:cullin-4
MKLSGGASATGVKLQPLVIKPLRPKASSDHSNDASFRESNWKSLKAAIDAIQNETAVSTSLEQLYRSVEELCVQKHAEWLYGKLRDECEGHAVKVLGLLASESKSKGKSTSTSDEGAGPMAAMSASPVSLDVLTVLGKCWDTYCSQLILIRHIFLYLDRTFLLQKSEHRSIFDMGLYFFRQHLDAEYVTVKETVVQGVLGVVDKERRGDAIQRDLLKNLIRMLALLGLYDGTFMPVFLDRARGFYTEEANRIVVEVSLGEYLLYVERRIAEECSRCDAALEPITRVPLVQTVEACVIEPHVGYMLEHGFEKLVDEDRLEDLKRMYDVYGRVRGHKALCAAFKNHLKNVGSRLVSDPDKDADMIREIIGLKKRVDAILDQCFNDITFRDAAKDAFGYFMNMRSNRPAELLAKHMDSILKGGGKAKFSEDDVETALDSCLALFRFISGKDAFEAFYKKDLAKRLLFNRSFSIDTEKSAISRLKAECGAHFTSKLEGMFTDSDLSKDIMSSFRGSQEAAKELAAVCPGTDISVQVLTSGLWPTYPLTECNFMPSLAGGLEVFKKHYLEKYSGRKLMWLHSLGTCVMKAQFTSGPKELAVSFFQASVLMAFEDVDTLTFKEILAATGIEDSELRRTLQSLACGRERVLIKEPKGKEVEDDDVFTFNANYTSKQYRVKINAIQMKETAEDTKKTNEMVMQDRQHQIDAAIVRIMKTRKTLSHKLLMNELMTQLRFPVTATDLKKRIESLIEREYMERDESDATVYNYVA